jgi:alkylated DNA nucleotide flippase Atl1
MKVIATAVGFSDKVRQVGETFEVPEGLKGSWFKPVPKDPKPKAEKTTAQDNDSLV